MELCHSKVGSGSRLYSFEVGELNPADVVADVYAAPVANGLFDGYFCSLVQCEEVCA